MLGDIQLEHGAALAKELGKAAVSSECNVTNEQHIAALVDRAVSEFGALDIMFNNAGIVGAVGPIATTPANEWSATLDVLLNGVFYGMKHAARVMQPRMKGSIISMASTAGIMGGLGPHAYCAAKHAVIGLTKNVGAELCRYGIRVNAIAPAGMATAMVAELSGDHTAIEATKRAREDLALARPARRRRRRCKRRVVARQRRVGLHQRPHADDRRRHDHRLHREQSAVRQVSADVPRSGQNRTLTQRSAPPHDRIVARSEKFMRAPPRRERGEDVRRIAVEFREAAVDLTRVEIRGVDVVGPQLARNFETHVEQPLPLCGPVVHEHADVVEALFALPDTSHDRSTACRRAAG